MSTSSGENADGRWRPVAPYEPYHSIRHTAPAPAREGLNYQRAAYDAESEGRYQRVYQLQPPRLAPAHHLPPLPALPSPSAGSPPLEARRSYFPAQIAPSSHVWARPAPPPLPPNRLPPPPPPNQLPPMRLKPPTPPTYPSRSAAHSGYPPWDSRSYGSREDYRQDPRVYGHDSHQYSGAGYAPAFAREDESGRALSATTSSGTAGSHEHAPHGDGERVPLRRADTGSEDEVDADGKKKRKRRRKANEPPRDAAMRKFVCPADGCGKSFAR